MTGRHVPVAGSPLGDAFAHHLWATERLIDACTGLTDEQLEASAPGTYGSIIATLRHLVSSDRWYLSFFPTSEPLPEVDEESGMTLEQLQAEMGRSGAAWTEAIGGLGDPDADMPEVTDEWEFHVPTGFRLAQAIHHGTDHRSQVCTALTTIGIEPPEIDLWAYGEATDRTRAVQLQASK
jgi:uncharacterized damage-inducible protein DinB